MVKVFAINADGAYSVDLCTNNFKKIESIEKIARSNNARYVQSRLLYKGIVFKKAVIKIYHRIVPNLQLLLLNKICV